MCTAAAVGLLIFVPFNNQRFVSFIPRFKKCVISIRCRKSNEAEKNHILERQCGGDTLSEFSEFKIRA